MRDRRFRLTFLPILLLLTHAAYASAPSFRVVIDPGHGGTDMGTVYRNGKWKVAEKDVTLLIARQVAKDLDRMGIQAVLTRNSDREISLGDRTAFANRLNANIFLSIHMNSTPTIKVAGEGIETYILNNATDASSRRLAHLENTVLGPRTADQDVDVALILKDLRLDANLTESKRLACSIQDSLIASSVRGQVSNRGVRQALFHVLLGADMPSVLVEAGFLSNEKDRKLALSPIGRANISESIASAIEGFRNHRNQLALSRCKVH